MTFWRSATVLQIKTFSSMLQASLQEALAKSLIAQSARIYVSHKKINFRLTSFRWITAKKMMHIQGNIYWSRWKEVASALPLNWSIGLASTTGTSTERLVLRVHSWTKCTNHGTAKQLMSTWQLHLWLKGNYQVKSWKNTAVSIILLKLYSRKYATKCST